jgi:DNA-binding transcriptional MerR regulator
MMPPRPAAVTATVSHLEPGSQLEAGQGAVAGPGSGVEADNDRLFTIGELAAAHDITTRTIRFYEAKGLISPMRKGVARSYARRDRARLTLILRGKNLGFSLEDIAEFLRLYDADPSQMAQARLLLDKLDAHITELQSKRTDLERTLKELKALKALCHGHLCATER